METKRKNEFLVTLKALDEACETLVMENDRNLQIIEMLLQFLNFLLLHIVKIDINHRK